MNTKTLNLSLTLSFIFLVICSSVVTGSSQTNRITSQLDRTAALEINQQKDVTPPVGSEESLAELLQRPGLELLTEQESWVYTWEEEKRRTCMDIGVHGKDVYVLRKEWPDDYSPEAEFYVRAFDQFGLPDGGCSLYAGTMEVVEDAAFDVGPTGMVAVVGVIRDKSNDYPYYAEGDKDGIVKFWNPDDMYAGWGFRLSGEQNDTCDDVVVDSYGNVYVVGKFSHFFDFNPGQELDVKVSNGSSDCYLMKLNADGSYGWARTWGGTGNDWPRTIGIDTNGVLYVTGSYQGEVDFDPGNGVDLHTASGGGDSFMLKFNASGNYLQFFNWDILPVDMVMDDNGNFYWHYTVYGTYDAAPGQGVHELDEANGNHFFAKLDQIGDVIWIDQWNEQFNSQCIDIAIDSSGAVYLTGWEQFVEFGQIDPRREVYLRKYDSAGNFIFETTWYAENGMSVSGVAVNEEGNIFSHF